MAKKKIKEPRSIENLTFTCITCNLSFQPEFKLVCDIVRGYSYHGECDCGYIESAELKLDIICPYCQQPVFRKIFSNSYYTDSEPLEIKET